MNNRIRGILGSGRVTWTNSVGASGSGAAAAVASGDVIKLGAVFAVACMAIATSTSGAVDVHGRYELNKATGVTYAVGQLLGYDFTNKRVTTDCSGGIVMQVTKAAATGDTVVEGNLNPGLRRNYAGRITPSAQNASDNYVEVDLGFPVANCAIYAMWHNTSGVPRQPTAITAPSANVIRVAETDVVTTDRLHLMVQEVVGA
jgi:predicted RecA/RadA family phage recombinase